MNGSANVVIDVPEHISPEEAAQLLNAPGEASFLVQVLPIAGGHRAYLRRYKQTSPTKAEAAKENAGTVEEATAMSILRAHREESVRTIVELLAKAGIKRGRDWVCAQLDATCAEDGREEEALAVVKMYPNYEPRDIVDELRHGYLLGLGRGIYKKRGIKRSIRWVRRKLDEAKAVRPPDNS